MPAHSSRSGAEGGTAHCEVSGVFGKLGSLRPLASCPSFPSLRSGRPPPDARRSTREPILAVNQALVSADDASTVLDQSNANFVVSNVTTTVADFGSTPNGKDERHQRLANGTLSLKSPSGACEQ